MDFGLSVLLGPLFVLWESQFSVEYWSLDLKSESDLDVNEILEVVMTFAMHFLEWRMKVCGSSSIRFENFSSVSRCDAYEIDYGERVNGWQGECKNCQHHAKWSAINFSRHFRARKLSNQPKSQKRLGSTSIKLTRWVFLLYLCMFPYFLFRKICVPYGSIYFCGNMGTICGNILQ